jgi:hypothetical protein
MAGSLARADIRNQRSEISDQETGGKITTEDAEGTEQRGGDSIK